jgi:hypothetical protein
MPHSKTRVSNENPNLNADLAIDEENTHNEERYSPEKKSKIRRS